MAAGRFHKSVTSVSLSLTFLSFLGSRNLSQGSESQPLRKVRMAFTSLSGSMSPPWYAQMGGIFKKNGLEVEVIAMPSGVEGMNALIAGEVQFLQIPGGTTVSGALGGALKAVLEELADRNPKAKEADPKKFFDDSFVRQMQASGFIDSLYR